MSRTLRIAAAGTSVAAALALALPVATAAPAATGPHITPASTVVSGQNSTNLVFKGSIDGVALTVTCKSITFSGKTPANGLKVSSSSTPKLSGCTDSTGNTDTVTTSGTWAVTANSTGSKITLDLPKDAATFTSNFLPTCHLVIAPNGPDTTINGTYNNAAKGPWTIKNSKFSLGVAAGSSCTAASTATISTVISFTPGVQVVS